MHQGRPTSIIQNNSNFVSLVLKPIHRLILPSWEQLSNLLSCGMHPWNLLLFFFHVPLLVMIEASICILSIAWKGGFKHLSSQVKVCLCLDADVTACWFLFSCPWIFLFILIKGKKLHSLSSSPHGQYLVQLVPAVALVQLIRKA